MISSSAPRLATILDALNYSECEMPHVVYLKISLHRKANQVVTTPLF
jgi:hypothetical protein